jgi:hypothetical protein
MSGDNLEALEAAKIDANTATDAASLQQDRLALLTQTIKSRSVNR